MYDAISANAMEILLMNCKVSKSIKVFTHIYFIIIFMSLSLCECKGYGFAETEGQS